MQQFLSYLTPTLLLPIITLAGLICFFLYYWHVIAPRPKKGSVEWIAVQEARKTPRQPITFAGTCHPMVKKDVWLMLLVTVAYAFTAFFQLGSTKNPQSFYDFGDGQALEIQLSQPAVISKIMYYAGLGTGDYNVEVSADGETWYTLWYRTDENNKNQYYWADAEGYTPSYALPQHYADLFKWLVVEPDNPVEVSRIRISGRADRSLLDLGELVLYDADGQVLNQNTAFALDQASPLFDEPSAIPDKPTWFNSTYFDEIYHARTADEHIRGIYPYEISHPPLGKLILSLGIQIFGMTPFGWRFMGTLFGVGMLPVLYLFLKNLFGKTTVAFCGTALFAFDFMHLTQTRIATIDTYAVFFILLMYYFMYRYLTLPAGTPFQKGAPWLLLSGLFWGIGAASKWTVIYGGIGLAILYFVGLYFKLRDWPHPLDNPEEAPKLSPWLIQTLAFSVLCFVVIPAVIYTLSYLPYAQAKGDTSLPGLLSVMWDNQKYMLTYHQGVHDSHPYSSRWYQWVVDGRPILYYLDSTSVPGSKAAFGAFSNPIVCWGGLLALIATAIQMVRKHCGKALLIVVAYFSQLAPWFAIGRTTFEYHYFPSILFLVFALCYVFDELLEKEPVKARTPIYAVTISAVALFALFYPVLIGLMVPTWYSTNLLRWLPSWPF